MLATRQRKERKVNHDVRELVQRELATMDWSNGLSRQALADHFRMAPTIREMIERHAPEKTYHSADDVLGAIPQSAWAEAARTVQHGSPESHYLQSRAAHFNIWGETPGFGHITEQEQRESHS